MNTYQAFNAEFPCDELDYLAVLRNEAENYMTERRKLNRLRPNWSEAERAAADNLMLWARQAREYRIHEPGFKLSRFVASHRHACIWAVLTALGM